MALTVTHAKQILCVTSTPTRCYGCGSSVEGVEVALLAKPTNPTLPLWEPTASHQYWETVHTRRNIKGHSTLPG